jgi:ABC-type nitrate/sulfonate/bicarbonate transport system substrate-binding protein
VGVGLVDPIRAIDKGAPIGIVRIIVQAAPYVLVAKPAIKTLKELKGKLISIGGPKDITRIYLDHMLAPNGIKEGEFEMVFAGSTAARFAALQSGAVDATFLTAPFNFYATAAGFADLGQTADYVKDMPFMGAAVYVPWASANQASVRKFLTAFGKAVLWFEDDRNRAEAISIMIQAGNMKPEDIERSYDFFRKGKYFEPRNQVSKMQIGKLVDALRELGDIQGPLDVNRLIASDVAEVVD